MPSYADIQSSVSSDTLNNRFPGTQRWWLNDPDVVYGVQSARVVNDNNHLNDLEYQAPSHSFFKWNGKLPIENIDNPEYEVAPVFSMTNTDSPYTGMSGTISIYQGFQNFTISLCSIKMVENVIQPCGTPDTPIKTYTWSTRSSVVARASFTSGTLVTTAIPASDEIQPGELLFIGELSLTDIGGPSGYSIMRVADSQTPTTVTRAVASIISPYEDIIVGVGCGMP